MIEVAPGVCFDEREITEEFMRAGGPGGQNVNKVETAVRLRFPAHTGGVMPWPVRERLLRLAGGRLTAEGEILIEASRHRTREQNRQDALARLTELLAEAACLPKKRRPTRATWSSRKKRVEGKRLQGEKKSLRRRPEG